MFIFLFARSFVRNPENHRRAPGQFLPREKTPPIHSVYLHINRLTCFGGLAGSRLVRERQIKPLRQSLDKRPLVYRQRLALASIHLAMRVLTERIPVSFIFRWHQIAISPRAIPGGLEKVFRPLWRMVVLDQWYNHEAVR